jgi:hypothetical protein
MKQIISIALAVFLGGAVVQSLLPWWSLPVFTALLGLWFKVGPMRALLGGLLGGALLWGGYAAVLNAQNDGLLSERIGLLLGGVSGLVLILLTAFIGGLFAGLGAWTGSLAVKR